MIGKPCGKINRLVKSCLTVFGMLVFVSGVLYAQPTNDDCDEAREIKDPSSYCSGKAEFTTAGATDSGYGPSGCWDTSVNDVWFSFTAKATGVNIVINGKNIGSGLRNPQATLYIGVCGGQIQELECQSDATGSGGVALIENGLVVGATYYIRVSGRSNVAGTFQLCITNFNPPVVPGQDCPTGAILCDKSAFVVQTLSGSGSLTNEGKGTCLEPFAGSQSEDQSTWLRWTAANNGTLTFDITPLKEGDDIDFALFELPGGIDDCVNKKPIRCNATSCDGPTGLNLTSTDTAEDFNCEPGEDRYVKYIDMVEGKSYGLLINNFDNTGIGFRIQWGGTGEFAGPKPDFTIDPLSGLRCDQDFTVTDASSFSNGTLVGYEWNFGLRAIPEKSTSKGPHQINYSSFGNKFISLTVTSDKGCKVTVVKSLYAEPCCEDLEPFTFTPEVTTPGCNGGSDGSIRIYATGGTPEYYFKFADGTFKPKTEFRQLSTGIYEIAIVDIKGCTDSISVFVGEPDPVIVDAGPDQEIELGDSTRLQGSYFPFTNGDSTWWSPSKGIRDINDLESYTVPPGTITYVLSVLTDAGCLIQDSLLIRVTVDRTVFTPNVMIANGNGGPNNFFNVYGKKAVKTIELLEVYDRWGNKVYKSSQVNPFDVSAGWDGYFNGNPVEQGVYTWLARVLYLDEVTEVYTGDLTVLRQ
ncbi:MAG: gliding motility-associated C-terminal domain-containing protein [Saprospiraceae bacterium]